MSCSLIILKTLVDNIARHMYCFAGSSVDTENEFKAVQIANEAETINHYLC